MMSTLSSSVAPQVVNLTPCDATGDDKIGIMMTLGFQCGDDQVNLSGFGCVHKKKIIKISARFPWKM